MMTLIQDLRYGLRMLAKNPGFTAVAVLTLALGIGANTAMFSVVHALLLRPLPFHDPGRLVMIEGIPAVAFNGLHTQVLHWEDWVSKTKTLEGVSIYEQGGVNLANGREPVHLPAAAVSAGFFRLLGVGPLLGRTFLPEEDAPRQAVAVISHDLWQGSLSADSSIVGKSLQLSAKLFTVVGVMPPGFEFPGTTQVWVPEALNQQENLFAEGAIAIRQVARLKQGVTTSRARAELEVFLRQLVQGNTAPFNPNLSVTPLHLELVKDVRPALLVLMGAVGLVLLIACANVANLLMARNVGRTREMGVRAALGASHKRLMSQLITESVLMSLAGGFAGLLIAAWGVKLARGLIPPTQLSASGIRLDGFVLGFTFGIAVLTGVLSGLLPAMRCSKPSLVDTLKEGSSLSSAWGFTPHRRFHTVLGAAEVALALILLIGAGLLIKSLGVLSEVHPGFRSDHLLTARLFLAGSDYAKDERRAEFFKQVRDRARALAGVREAAFINSLPLGEGVLVMFSLGLEGTSTPKPQTSAKWAMYLTASPDYFQAMGIPLLKGRAFTDRDCSGSQRVAVVSETMARFFWPNEDPIGKRVTKVDPAQWMTVVGVVGDVRDWGLSEASEPQMYVPILQEPSPSAFLVLHTSGPVAAAELGSVVRAVDRAQPVASVRTVEELLVRATATPRFRTLILGIFAGLAALLALVGIYGVMAYAVGQRTHEIGIRMALGAKRSHVLTMVLRQGLVLALAGVATGFVGALALSRLLTSFLYGVRATDLSVFAGVSLGLMAVALIAVVIPACRATKVDPMVALRHE